MANEAIVEHLGSPQMAVGHLSPAAIKDFSNVFLANNKYCIGSYSGTCPNNGAPLTFD